jgi:hypothetical protein
MNSHFGCRALPMIAKGIINDPSISTSYSIIMHTRRSSNIPPLLQAATGKAAAQTLQCSWTPADEERMILFLLSKKEAAADGATFKSVVWNALATHMAQHHTTGAMKTDNACKSKYSRVSASV